MLGKQHNTSWHAALGLFAIGGYALAAAGGLSALHPDWGVAKTNQKLRLAHKLSARTFTAVAFLALVTGWNKQDSKAAMRVTKARESKSAHTSRGSPSEAITL